MVRCDLEEHCSLRTAEQNARPSAGACGEGCVVRGGGGGGGGAVAACCCLLCLRLPCCSLLLYDRGPRAGAQLKCRMLRPGAV